MGMFSRIFSSPEKPKTNPVGDVGVAIIKAAHTCTQALKSKLNFSDAKEKQQTEAYVFFEFIYFFMHLTMRSAFSLLTEQQITGLQGYLGPLISSTAVDSYFAHWPENQKEKILSDFYSKLNDAESEYSTSKEIVSGKFLDNSLFSKMARKLEGLSGNNLNPMTNVFIQSSAADAYKAMDLNTLVSKAGKVL